MNEYLIQLKGKASLPNELSIGNNYKIVAEGAITEEKKTDKDDGDFIITYKFSPILVEIENDKGERIRAKDTRKRSQQLRAAIWTEWKNSNSTDDPDDYYDKRMLGILNDIIT